MDKFDLNKNYWVFGIETYYPQGGLDDLCGTFDTLKDAREFTKRINYTYIQIFDVNKRVMYRIYK